MIMILLGCILFFGVEIRVDFDDTDMLGVASVYVFGSIRVLYFKLKLHNAEIFWKINNSPYRRFILPEKVENPLKYISKKKITIDTLNIVGLFSDEENALNPIKFVSIFTVFSEMLGGIENNYFNIKNYNHNILPNFNGESIKSHIYMKIKLGILSLIYNIIISKIINVRRKYAVRQSDR